MRQQRPRLLFCESDTLEIEVCTHLPVVFQDRARAWNSGRRVRRVKLMRGARNCV